jgi:hypothetical protein
MTDETPKNKNIPYWIATALMCLAMGGGGTADLLRIEDLVTTMDTLGYPVYLLTILGVAKWLGVVTVLAPGFKRLKEWAYAGFTIDLVGATLSHAAVKDPISDTVTPLIVLAIVLTSYALRPDSRKLLSA